jgi:hypothetical protein
MDIIEVCKASWYKYGWKLEIIGEKEARANHYYNEYKSIILDLPSVNPIGYDYHCFMRWLSMISVGGGIMIDYDVINMGLYSDTKIFNNKGLSIYQGHVPCVVSGSADDYMTTIKTFASLKDDMSCRQLINDTYHTSDMLMLASGKINFNSLNIAANYPNRGSLIHCSHAACQKNNESKLQIMSNLLSESYKDVAL